MKIEYLVYTKLTVFNRHINEYFSVIGWLQNENNVYSLHHWFGSKKRLLITRTNHLDKQDKQDFGKMNRWVTANGIKGIIQALNGPSHLLADPLQLAIVQDRIIANSSLKEWV